MASRSEEIDMNSPLVRENLVETAVKFLENPKVAHTALAQKQNFLRRKGLTDEEIKLACERSGAYALHEQQNRSEIIPPLQPPVLNFQTYPYGRQGQMQISLLDRIREIAHNFAVLSFIAYVVYRFYQRFIAPFLFGKKKSLEDSVEDLSKEVRSSVEELQSSLNSVKIEIDRIRHGSDYSTSQKLSELKSEVATVKGLLLSRKQFPTVSSNSPVVPPSIPAWQMSSVTAESDADHEGKSEEMEVASGSGSSEPEHCTHKSDSSLEIIYSKESDNESYHARKSGDDIERD